MSELFQRILIVIAIIFILYVFVFRLPKHRHNFWYLKELIFSPKTFIALSAEDAIKKNCKTNREFGERYDKDEKWKNEQIERFKKQFSESTQKLRNSVYQAFITVVITLFCAWAIAYIAAALISFSSNALSIIQMVSAFSILSALVGKLGYPIQTIKGETLPETIDNFWFIFLNVLGIFCLFFSQFYSLFKK